MNYEIKHITKSFENGAEQRMILSDITLTLAQGESICLTGPSGSGKSTLLSIMGGLESPDSGEVFVDGKGIFALSDAELSKIRRERFGFVFQQFNLIPNLSAKENICLPLLFSGRETDDEKLSELSEILGISSLLHQLPQKLSGGEQQRVAIARALLPEPEIIFADEPTGSLDQNTGKKVISLLQELIRRKKKTLVLVTHDRGISSLFERQISILDGKLV